MIEIRVVHEMSEFPEDVQNAAEGLGDLKKLSITAVIEPVWRIE